MASSMIACYRLVSDVAASSCLTENKAIPIFALWFLLSDWASSEALLFTLEEYDARTSRFPSVRTLPAPSLSAAHHRTERHYRTMPCRHG